jgi:phage shock protein C
VTSRRRGVEYSFEGTEKMHDEQPNLLTRDDTFFGVCQGLGEDLGLNPLWLRLALTLALFASPLAAIGGYLALGALVLTTRLLFPPPQIATAEPVAATPGQAPLADNDCDAGQSTLAA